MKIIKTISYTSAMVLLAATQTAFSAGNTVVTKWNEAALDAIRTTHPGPPIVARSLAITHTCMYDAWTAYDNKAKGAHFVKKLAFPVVSVPLPIKKKQLVTQLTNVCLIFFQPKWQNLML